MENKTEFKTDPFVERIELEPYFKGDLTGLSFAVKDNIDIENYQTGYGSPGWANTHHKAVANAVIVDQLLGAGAKCLGKTCLDELAYSLLGINHFSGTPLNPKYPDRIPGGSSSGSASAVASKEVDFAIGTDTGGSIRVPAANCGIWGYRSSHGIISVSGVLPLAPSYDAVGIVSQTGETLEKVVKSILSENESGYKDLTVCFLEDFFEVAEKGIRDILEKPLKVILENFNTKSMVLSEMGEGISQRQLFDHLGYLLSSEIWNTFGSWMENEKPLLSKEVALNLTKYAKSLDRKEIFKMYISRKKFQNRIGQFLSGGNIICFPTIINFPPELSEMGKAFDGEYIIKAMGVNALSSLSGAPQVTFPVVSDKEMPVGLSFMAGYGDDMELINFCNRIFETLR